VLQVGEVVERGERPVLVVDIRHGSPQVRLQLIRELRQSFTIVIVTHNMQQAARVSDATAFFYMGELIEHGPTEQIFTNPRESRTEDYVTGKFG